MSNRAKHWIIGIAIFQSLFIAIMLFTNSLQSNIQRTQIPLTQTNQTSSFVAKIPVLTKISVQDTDPHICNKSDDAVYYAHSRYAANERRGEVEGYQDPKFLFDASREGNTVNWANGFKGTVPVCFIVDEQGNVTDLHFFQSPGDDLEGHINKAVGSMKFSPGTYNRDPVKVQMAYNLVFN